MLITEPAPLKTKGDEILQFDIFREMNELRNQISMIKRIGFFFGAGSSMAVGMPGIYELTEKVKSDLTRDEQQSVQTIEDSIKVNLPTDSRITIEDILNQIRLIRQITKDSKSQDFQKVCGEQAKFLDLKICKEIYDTISIIEGQADFSLSSRLISWINWFSREFSKEIFTTNYDLVFEKSFEALQIPYYDGFIGANEPFFLPESIETGSKVDSPPVSWIRLWKLHGSLGWFWKKNSNGQGSKVIRLGILGKERTSETEELVIYPSKEKYELSRKQPFIAYFDRLKHYLNEGEGLFIISGYSFSDEHINEIFFNSLQQNNRLHIIAFLFSDSDIEKVRKCCKPFLNFTAYGPSNAIISGNYGRWNTESENKDSIDDVHKSYWDTESKKFKLGDFSNLVNFLIEISGKQEKINSGTR